MDLTYPTSASVIAVAMGTVYSIHCSSNVSNSEQSYKLGFLMLSVSLYVY